MTHDPMCPANVPPTYTAWEIVGRVSRRIRLAVPRSPCECDVIAKERETRSGASSAAPLSARRPDHHEDCDCRYMQGCGENFNPGNCKWLNDCACTCDQIKAQAAAYANGCADALDAARRAVAWLPCMTTAHGNAWTPIPGPEVKASAIAAIDALRGAS